MLDDARKLPDGKAMLLPRRRAMLDAIEAERARLGLSVDALCVRAALTPGYYRRMLTGQHNGTSGSLRRLAKAVRGQDAALNGVRMLQTLAFDALVAKLLALGVTPLWKARTQAIYITHVEIGLSQGETADLAGVAKQYVGRVTQMMEDRRDSDADFEAAIIGVLAPQYRHEGRAA
jgi:predicted transcriptional regulator